MEDVITPENLYKYYLFVESRIVPNLNISESAVYRFAFFKAVVNGNTEIKLSIREILQYVPISPKTASIALKGLIRKKCLLLKIPPSSHKAGFYKVLFPDLSTLGKMFPLEHLEHSERYRQNVLYVDRLDYNDLIMLDTIISTLSESRRKIYLKQAEELSKQDLIDPEKAFKEIVIRNEFGPSRLKKYQL